MIKQFLDRGFYDTGSRVKSTGSLAWAPVAVLLEPNEMRVLKYTPGSAWSLERLSQDDFTSRSHEPMAVPVRLETNEEFVMAKAKRRPVVMLSSEQLPELWDLHGRVGQLRGRQGRGHEDRLRQSPVHRR